MQYSLHMLSCGLLVLTMVPVSRIFPMIHTAYMFIMGQRRPMIIRAIVTAPVGAPG
jgi:hypothetical protein